MEYFRYIVRFIYHIRWYLVTLPLLVLIVAWFMTRNLDKEYSVKTTIYTGIISGYNIETGMSTGQTGNPKTNLENLIHIITTEKTLKRVSLRLFARIMMYGDPSVNTNFITAQHYQQVVDMTPKEVQALIDKNDEARTVANLLAYERPSADNFIYALLNGSHPYFSVPALSENIKVAQLSESDMIEIGYSANDPGIAFNTLDILNEEFIDQYQDIRFGETNNVIKFFEGEVARLYRILTNSEDSLISYNVSKRIFNYSEQTRQVAAMDATHKWMKNDLLMDYTTTKALSNFLENKMGNVAVKLRDNSDFLSQLNNVSKLKSRISNLELINDNTNPDIGKQLLQAKDQMARAEKNIRNITQQISTTTGTESVKSSDLVGRWLDQVLSEEKAKAEMGAMGIMRNNIDKEFLYYSPIGATLSRKERHITFIENNYMSMLDALNSARLRQKNLQMTTATLKILNPPLFPLNALPTNRLMILLSAYVLTFLFIIGYFFIIELLDHTLRDRQRAERLTKSKVLGCYPKESTLRYRRFNKSVGNMALRQLSKSILPYFKEGQPNVLNLLSTEEKNGKTLVATELEEYWNSIGLEVHRITYDEDFLSDDKSYVMAQSVKDLCPDIQDNEILIVEYPNLADHSISPALLNMGTVNLMITRANRTWKNTDQQTLNNVKSMLGNKDTFFMYLTQADRDSVEEFTGQLPPYTMFKNFVYRISQMGLTAVENNRAK